MLICMLCLYGGPVYLFGILWGGVHIYLPTYLSIVTINLFSISLSSCIYTYICYINNKSEHPSI